MRTPGPAKVPLFSRIALRLPPAEKALPAPVRITQRMSRSALMREAASANSSPSPSSPSGLRESGRLIVSVTIGPDLSKRSAVMVYSTERSVALEVMIDVAVQRVDHRDALEVVAERQFVGHAHAAVDLHRVLA